MIIEPILFILKSEYCLSLCWGGVYWGEGGMEGRGRGPYFNLAYYFAAVSDFPSYCVLCLLRQYLRFFYLVHVPSLIFFEK